MRRPTTGTEGQDSSDRRLRSENRWAHSYGGGKFGGYQVLILPDHFTPSRSKPTLGTGAFHRIFFEEQNRPPKEERSFNEESAREAGLLVERGHELMEKFIQGFAAA